jgi:hypothetical protein
MKRLFIIFFSMILLAACQKDVVVDGGSASTLTYSLSTGVSFEVKGTVSDPGEVSDPAEVTGGASKINVLWYGVYHKKSDGTYSYMSDMSAFVEVTDPNSIQVPITLITGQEYELVFVAQHRILSANDDHTYMYTISDDAVMSRNPSAAVTSGEQLDVFVFVDKVGPIVGNITKSITLERPVAQINVGTSAGASAGSVYGPGISNIDVDFSNVPQSYDIRTRTYSGTTSLSFENLPISAAPIKVGNIDYTSLTTLYILGGNRVDMTISSDSNHKTISNIATAPNYKTNVVGNI